MRKRRYFDMIYQPMDLHRYLSQVVGEMNSKQVIAFLEDELGLPMPEKHEFCLGSEGCILFLTDYGVSIRFHHKNEYDPTPRTDFEVPPLGWRIIGDIMIAIYPGVKINPLTNAREQDILKYAIEKQGAEFWDACDHNTGRLPIDSKLFDGGMPVVIDIPGIKEKQDATDYMEGTDIDELYAKEGIDVAVLAEKYQKTLHKLYGKHQQNFERIFRGQSIKADQTALKKFWRDLHADTQKNSQDNRSSLRSEWANRTTNAQSWDDRHVNRLGIHASLYQKRLRAHPLHQSLVGHIQPRASAPVHNWTW